MKKMLLVAAASTAIFASTAFAGEDAFYVKVQAGASILNKVKVGDTDVKLKSNTAPVFGAAVGYNVMDMVRAELELNYIHNPEFKKSGTFTVDGVSGVNGSLKIKGKAGSLMVNGYVDFAEVDSFKFFAGAGIGVAQLSEKLSNSDLTWNGITVAPASTEKVKHTYNFAYQLALGTSAEVADGVKVELTYKWSDYGKTKDVKTPYKGNSLVAGVRFEV